MTQTESGWIEFADRRPDIDAAFFVGYLHAVGTFDGPYITVRKKNDRDGSLVLHKRGYSLSRIGESHVTHWHPLGEWESEQLHPAPTRQEILAAHQYPHIRANIADLCIQYFEIDKWSPEGAWWQSGNGWINPARPPLYWQSLPRAFPEGTTASFRLW